MQTLITKKITHFLNKTLELQTFYDRTCVIWLGFENKFDGLTGRRIRTYRPDVTWEIYRDETCRDTMDEIRVYLKLMSGQTISMDESEIRQRSGLDSCPRFGRKIFIDEIINPYIKWLVNIIRKCVIVKRVIRRAQQRFLEEKYHPDSSLVAEVALSFHNR